MSVKEQVLGLFDNCMGEYLSGEEIAAKLSVSRAAVWKAVKSLQEEGYHIDAVTNKGYCLSPDTDRITAVGICRYLGDLASSFDFEVHKSVTSTNTLAKEQAANGVCEGKVLIAEEQTKGRGRLGRSFFSPSGTGIYLSLVLKPSLRAADAILLTTAAAVAVSEAIESVSGKSVQIKWVNDLYMQDKKVCGILTEASLDMESGGLEYVVLGIGINTFTPQNGFPDDLTTIATSIYDKQRGDFRNRLIAAVLNRFWHIYQNPENRSFVAEYKRRSLVIGKTVTVIRGDSPCRACVLAIDDDCRLRVRYENGEEAVLSSGEISLRL